jgi:hypothetical protein
VVAKFACCGIRGGAAHLTCTTRAMERGVSASVPIAGEAGGPSGAADHGNCNGRGRRAAVTQVAAAPRALR